MHVDNLEMHLECGGIYAPNHILNDKLLYKTIHNSDIQSKRQNVSIPCGEKGVMHDYVPFYFGYLSPMMLQLKTGQVEDYNEGQEPLIYLVSTAQNVKNSGTSFVFSNGHGIPAYTCWYDDLDKLDQVDWSMVCERYWKDTPKDMDRQRRKQAEFLIYQFCTWSLIKSIVVINAQMKTKVETIMNRFAANAQRDVHVEQNWYY